VIGSIERSASYNHGIELYRGILNIGEPRASPVIRSLKEHIDDSRTVIIDSPPGTSCPVIASISGADLVFIVAEPSASAIHDLERVIKAAAHFRIKTVVCINRCDINKEKAAYIEDYCTNNGVKVIGKLPLSETPTKAMLEGRTVIEYKDDVFTGTVQDIWYRVYSELVS
jgi:MinD superfamily P-loop ATPase